MLLTQPEAYGFKPRVRAEADGSIRGISVTGDYVERPWFSEVHDGLDTHRNGLVVAHRRGGKTVGMCAQGVRETFRCQHSRPVGAYIAPTAKQARDVAYQYFVQMLEHLPGVTFRRHQLEIEIACINARIIFASGENYDRLRGLYLDWAIVDEMADCPEALIPTVLLPALEDRGGKLWLIGTVRGLNHFWMRYLDVRDNPDWYAGIFTPDRTGVFTDEQLEYMRREMGEDAYRQEILCDPSAASRGAYYAQTLSDHVEQQTSVPYTEELSTVAAFDLGIADSTAVWLAQLHPGGEIRLIDYLEYQNTGFVQILRELRELPYVIDRWIGPHDLNVREYSTGQSRIDAARGVGVDFEVAPRLPVIDGIEAVRRALPRCWFDSDKCKQGLICLQQYRSEFDEKRRVLSRNPVHDWSSHGADAFRYLITGTDGGRSQMTLSLPPLEYNRGGRASPGNAPTRVNAWR